MINGFMPNYNLEARIQHTKLDGFAGMPAARIDSTNETDGKDFKSVMSGLVGNLNETLSAPDNLMKDVMMGNENVDIHDVAIAMSKAEISVNIATTAVGKVIQAYDRITQIQI